MEASYLPPHVDTDQVFIAPLDANVELLRTLHQPPAICITAGKDCFKYEADKYMARLEEAGFEVIRYECPDAIHGFNRHKKDYEDERVKCWTWVTEFLQGRFMS